MYIGWWSLLFFGALFFYLGLKLAKHEERIHDLQYDLHELEVKVGVIKGDEWAINFKKDKSPD